jgi:hypothetical protein
MTHPARGSQGWKETQRKIDGSEVQPAPSSHGPISADTDGMLTRKNQYEVDKKRRHKLQVYFCLGQHRHLTVPPRPDVNRWMTTHRKLVMIGAELIE